MSVFLSVPVVASLTLVRRVWDYNVSHLCEHSSGKWRRSKTNHRLEPRLVYEGTGVIVSGVWILRQCQWLHSVVIIVVWVATCNAAQCNRRCCSCGFGLHFKLLSIYTSLTLNYPYTKCWAYGQREGRSVGESLKGLKLFPSSIPFNSVSLFFSLPLVAFLDAKPQLYEPCSCIFLANLKHS